MLSKEKIESRVIKIKSPYNPYLSKELNDKIDGLSRICYKEGARWASEQYAGVVNNLNELITKWFKSELTIEYVEYYFNIIEEELNKLKQP